MRQRTEPRADIAYLQGATQSGRQSVQVSGFHQGTHSGGAMITLAASVRRPSLQADNGDSRA